MMSSSCCLVLLALSALLTEATDLGKGKPCLVDGILYPSGQPTDDACDRCFCTDGRVRCTLLPCWTDEINHAAEGRQDSHKHQNPDLITY